MGPWGTAPSPARLHQGRAGKGAGTRQRRLALELTRQQAARVTSFVSERGWPPQGHGAPPRGRDPFSPSPSWLSHRPDKLQVAFTPVCGVDSSERSHFSSLMLSHQAQTLLLTAPRHTTHDTRPGRNGRREPWLLGNRTSREAVKGVSFQRKRVRSQKHSCSQRQAAHAFPHRHFKFPAKPCLPGVCTPHSAFLRADPALGPSGRIEATHVCFKALLNRAGHCADLPARWPEFQTEQAHTADCSLPRSGHGADTVQQ